uniref:Uncharacterized protein n=1 Tax=Heliothis virescens TaxID=7102 RepID=A0A2A4JCJ2_HELVI
MKRSVYIILVYALSVAKCAIIPKSPNEDEQQKIEELERARSAIYNEINTAIEDTIKTLEKSNDSDARDGINYMRDLLKQITEFNGTELVDAADLAANSTEDTSDLQELTNLKTDFLEDLTPTNNSTPLLAQSGRRKGHKATGYEHIKKNILSFGKFSSLVGGAGAIVSKKKQERMKNLLEVQAKLDAWMLEREKERERIRKYKAGLAATQRAEIITENCPDFGEARVKRSKSQPARQGKYPCCRKCCKKSYMGCL